MSKSKPYCLSPCEKCNTFCTIWAILVGNRAGSHIQGSEPKLDIACVINKIPGELNTKNIG